MYNKLHNFLKQRCCSCDILGNNGGLWHTTYQALATLTESVYCWFWCFHGKKNVEYQQTNFYI